MGLPSKKRTNRSKRDRASHFALKPTTIQTDASGNPHLPHHATKAGSYNGRTVATKAVKRAARRLRKPSV
ncbi:MAG: 50S ribosomal protein L32 [Candidatus Magasanikbacteria bacterium RIFCSPHIGHO2_01_FULL_41_23]|uniref:Large ribosomal subunit protein bL32 n=1 Tax=Candidatus Magasanikbacteria bacterium RIFCSPLOWO2_01_FULL_40_15 TaxID=1798686 RepID=A0A1F6N3X2_9BACT|nr:MAG: 50S ribosomal protein L32 [Candidatus Magasanikbacteria bacterium RIFCSPHIGHO2_01_FULL_41_23]OGH67160.1 MAG: 50S ribosomal protein L32 [Candidatus Magasanikbacteria bacterium RIFCSPHIGHO2_02_FULL_41_35]OGH75475.1 MAG: 50S ribosomal protein L32 [Candidatus Magasanikbacteria bacterium RIFCSPHIGHO2_12_FULL_41_16]OGH78696.1 MAG: 50S ribosomal protein L32 [Candidatus Magasanikbacteria bacterium RIFCSPLOWO2_01_FULL_40_15]